MSIEACITVVLAGGGVLEHPKHPPPWIRPCIIYQSEVYYKPLGKTSVRSPSQSASTCVWTNDYPVSAHIIMWMGKIIRP